MALSIDTRIKLNDGHTIPQLGFGVWQVRSGRTTEAAVTTALEAGYRHIDTAAAYGNEGSVGAAIRASGIRREEIFVTTKLWNDDHGDPEGALDTSLRNLKMDYVDIYLIHFPVRRRHQSWKIFAKLRAKGKARSIGVSNYTVRHMTELLQESDVVPAANQVEIHPYLQQRELVEFCRARGVVIEAYSPLTHGERLNDPKLTAIAQKYSSNGASAPVWKRFSMLENFTRPDGMKTTAQALIRWALQKGYVVIPKSSKPRRVVENADVFDFELSEEDMRTLDGFEENLRTCWDPTNAP
ncbi:MAG TPA: aldo/keto reductase [Candidatus Binatia bacterium]|jgi:diketogulonate reductase-like aldo/keto reductase